MSKRRGEKKKKKRNSIYNIFMVMFNDDEPDDKLLVKGATEIEMISVTSYSFLMESYRF